MITRLFCFLALAAVAACGADGEPVQPAASVNVGVGANGVSTSGTIGVNRGALSVGVSVF